MIPLHLKTTEFTEPAAPLYYLVAANGMFLVKKSALFASITSAPSVPALARQSESLRLSFPKIPRRILEPVYGFFCEVYRKWDGEAIVLLYYSPEQETFRVGVPPQTLFRYRRCGEWRTEMRLTYGHYPRPEGFLKLGDAHSHGDMPAFFSYTDDRDDREDGLRITIGRLDRRTPDISASFVVSGTRFLLKPEETLEGFSAPLTPPRQWLKQVTCQYEEETAPQSCPGPNGRPA